MKSYTSAHAEREFLKDLSNEERLVLLKNKSKKFGPMHRESSMVSIDGKELIPTPSSLYKKGNKTLRK